MAAYLIVNFQIDDADAYKGYQKGAVAALKIGDEAKLVAYDTETTHLEGETAGSQTVVLEFESKERAQEIYDSGDYQAVLPARFGATSKHFGILANGA